MWFQYQFANYSNADYAKTGNASLMLQLINQRADFSFALFSGGFQNVRIFSALFYNDLEIIIV